MQAQWEPTGSDLAPLRARRQEQKRQELLALAFGLRLGVKGTLFWKPIKLLVCPQISNSPLGKRGALKDVSEKQCNYEKVHNFKVSKYMIVAVILMLYCFILWILEMFWMDFTTTVSEL